MILSDTRIIAAMGADQIVIRPYDRESLGSNSYDVHLGPTLLVYEDEELDCRKPPTPGELTIPEEGIVLLPGELYLGSTIEYTETHGFVPFLEGKSSLGRLGLAIHVTAGKGDVGFKGHWTMEITVVKRTRVYAGMPVGQIIYYQVEGNVARPYDKKVSAKYSGQAAKPQPSQMYRNFPESK